MSAPRDQKKRDQAQESENQIAETPFGVSATTSRTDEAYERRHEMANITNDTGLGSDALSAYIQEVQEQVEKIAAWAEDLNRVREHSKLIRAGFYSSQDMAAISARLQQAMNLAEIC